MTLDGRKVVSTRRAGNIRLQVALLKPGRHVVALGTGKKARKLTVQVAACKSSLRVRQTKKGATLSVSTVPGTSKVDLTLAKGATARKLVVQSGRTFNTIVLSGLKTSLTRGGLTVTRTATGISVSGLPVTTSLVRLEVRTTRRVTAASFRAAVHTSAGSTSQLR